MKSWQLWFHTISLKFPFSYLWNNSNVGLTDNKSLIFVDKAKTWTCVPDELIAEISFGLGQQNGKEFLWRRSNSSSNMSDRCGWCVDHQFILFRISKSKFLWSDVFICRFKWTESSEKGFVSCLLLQKRIICWLILRNVCISQTVVCNTNGG